MHRSTPRISVAFAIVLFIGAGLVVGVLSPAGLTDVGAQPRPAATIFAIQIPPLVPGIDYSPAETDEAPIADPALTAATPPAPIAPSSIVAPDSGGSLTATLGGSDVAASSVGGSHEVDRPGRRGNRPRD